MSRSQKTIEDLRDTLHNLDVWDVQHPDYRRYLLEAADYVQQAVGVRKYVEVYDVVGDVDRNLRQVYGDGWHVWRPNEHAAIIKRFVRYGHDAEFMEHMLDYAVSGDDLYLHKASQMLETKSVPMLHSWDVPVRYGRTPGRIQAVIGNTIIPRDPYSWHFSRYLRGGPAPRGEPVEMRHHPHLYVWRTVHDDKVRSSHASNDGKIYDDRDPPPTGNPGEGYNCRCTADYDIPTYVDIVEEQDHDMLHNVSHQPENSDIPSWEGVRRAYENADEATKKRMEEEYWRRIDPPLESAYTLEELVGLVFVAGKIPKILRGVISVARSAIGAVMRSSESRKQIDFFENPAQIKHIFRKRGGHVLDTSQNRRYLLDTVRDKKNFLCKDKFGVDWYQKTLEDSRQTWARVRNNKIIDAGINKKVKDIIKEHPKYFK